MQNDQKKINVAYIFNDFDFGGAAQSLLDTLASIGDSVNPFVVIREGAPVEDRFDEAGIKYYKIKFSTDHVKSGAVNDKLRSRDIVQSYEAALQLLPIIKSEKIQLIHINSSTSYFAALAALMSGIPYVWHIRELMEEQFSCSWLNEKIKIALYQKADRLITISDYVKQKYYEKYSLETLRIYNGLDIQRFRRSIEVNRVFNNTFIVPGAITPQKGQFDVIRAVKILCEKGYRDIRAVIVGNGNENYLWALNKYIKWNNMENNICILPFCKDLSRLREQASYAITASQCEALGRVTIEAMLAGNFVIGARSGATTEIIGENEERGFLYELHDCESLADTMIRAMECSYRVKNQMITEAQRYAEATFDSKKYCRILVELYQETIDTHRPEPQETFLVQIKEQYQDSKEAEKQEIESDERYIKAEKAYYNAARWLQIRQNGHTLDEYFQKNRIRSIAIYGMAMMGRMLYDELENGMTEIRYLIDKNPGYMRTILDFASLNDEKLNVDAIVVTVAGAERRIVEEIKGKGYPKVIGLSEILADFQNNVVIW